MHLRSLRVLGVSATSALVAVSPALSQGVQTGTVSGTVRSSDNMTLPGVTVTVTSPALQGEREAVSDTNGVYYLGVLPPGSYRVTFAIPGFEPVLRENVAVSAGAIVDVGATLSLARVAESVTVTAKAPSPLAQPGISRAFAKREIDQLPVGRRPVDIAELAPSVTPSAFNANTVSVAGGFGYDNVFMVNGVDVNDNINGAPNALYIEDAIQETSVLASGLSAEFGRFSGGVVNVITKSGGNTFSGSYRENLSNPSWIEETPL
jgi:hypothetical protein